ncbi:TolC family protein [Sedimentibacter sp. B4]|uniref:TolC family protein n=1 Tax=Sedimentibacter sp. B4 TaxID=304766 RepID=UPI000306360F|nr:TolC family protein [Sedimentibacter sp. B4]
MNIKRITACTCASAILLSAICPVYADTTSKAEPTAAPYSLPGDSDDDKPEEALDSSSSEKAQETMNLTVDTAVKYGLENNKSIDMLENKIQLAIISANNAKKNSSDLKKAKDALKDAMNKLDDAEEQIDSAQGQVDQAESLLSNGIAPISIPLSDSHGNPINDANGNQIVIPAGSNILDTLIGIGIPSETANGMFSLIKQSIETELNSNQSKIDENSIAVNEAKSTLEAKKEEFKDILKDTSEKLDAKIDYGSLVNLDAYDAGELMITMAGVNLDVTRYAKNIYKNQIAMLIQKNYYDALYARKVYELKKVAMERGEKQYNMVKLSYDNGMKAKDDLLLSKMYYDSTIISCRLAGADYKNALVKLKENMNLKMDTEITLQDSMFDKVTEENLSDGLKSGLTNRIEIQKALGQLKIYELNEEILNSRAEYKANKNGIKEAKLLTEGARLQLDKAKTTVTSEINQSYETMTAAGDMLLASTELVANAEEVVRIANLKYEQGFGAENALLKQMNLQESSGTIIELIAAQEKLSEVEAQVAQISYGYTMAKIKYQNDAGILIH